jgi:hypothetical protein
MNWPMWTVLCMGVMRFFMACDTKTELHNKNIDLFYYEVAVVVIKYVNLPF